jgi:phage terminase large subunit-like protein
VPIQILNRTHLSCPPRYSTPRTNRPSYGPRVGQVVENLGYRFMPWQQHVVDVALEVDPRTGLLVYRECGLTVPRQSGKTALLLGIMVHRAIAFITAHEDSQRILYAAQKRISARAKWEDEHLKILNRSRYKSQYTIRKQIGQEAIRWHNGSLHGITAAGETSGHGETLDLGVIDEAFAQTDTRLEQAFKPAMLTRDQPQIWINSTAGTAKSTFLRGKVNAGRQLSDLNVTTNTCYFEWSAPNEADPGDPAVWRSCMPALGFTVKESTIRAEYETAVSEGKLGDFRRAYLNQWQDEFPDDWLVIRQSEWLKSFDESSKPVGRLIFSVDTTPDRSMTSINVCGKRRDGLFHVEVLAHRPGTDWVLTAMKTLLDHWSGRGWPVVAVIDPASGAGSLITELEDIGVTVIKATAQEYVQACGLFYDKLTQGHVRHIGQPALTSAVAGATKRVLEAAWAWARKGLSVDICPLVGVTLALWGFTTTDPDDDYDVLDSVG